MDLVTDGDVIKASREIHTIWKVAEITPIIASVNIIAVKLKGRSSAFVLLGNLEMEKGKVKDATEPLFRRWTSNPDCRSFLHIPEVSEKETNQLERQVLKKNGGPILQQKLLNAKIFTLEQLIKATNNFDERLIIGKGHISTVFKGILSNNRVVAIKKFRELDQNVIEEFIDWLVLLEQIRHRNVVPILGCCLESEVPLLVYEFFNNGTVFDHLHKEEKINLSWKTRLQIATEAARALDYLHSGATIPIIHSKVSSGNILLDDTYTAKLLFDFRNLSLSSMHEIGLDLYYLDPEYIHTGQLTEKSDVYGFGVVLAELIIGEKTIHVEKPDGGFPFLAKQFILTLEKNCWLDILETGIVNKENEDEFIQVALLAAKCLRLHAKERPSMGMVAMELKNIRQKHQIKHNSDLSLTKSLRLFDDPSGTFEHGSSSTSSVQNSGYESCTDSMQDGLYSVI
ncbi:putative wall-associated receptor kinase-like 16 [Arachis hypogaea]|nr:putative wall-associated receptor kinase-like 16 [Arachis hypogaea]